MSMQAEPDAPESRMPDFRTPDSYMFILGSYTEADKPGLHVCTLDARSGDMRVRSSHAGLRNPTFADIDSPRSIVYAIAETTDEAGNRQGAAAAFALEEDGELAPLNAMPTVPSPTCHIALDRTGRLLIVSSYHGGMVGASPVEQDGRVGALSDLHRHSGASVLPVQNQPRAHSATVDRNNRFAAVCDLGLDRILVYRLNQAEAKLVLHSSAAVAPGSGPRHFAFHPSLPFAYAINELNSTVTAFSWNEETGTLTPRQTVPTLPGDYAGDNACADIHISPDGAWLYGSNRGHDSIASFRIRGSDGALLPAGHTPTMGRHPRNFALTPDGAWMLVANRDTDNVVAFARNRESGELKPAGHSLEVAKPVCIKFRNPLI